MAQALDRDTYSAPYGMMSPMASTQDVATGMARSMQMDPTPGIRAFFGKANLDRLQVALARAIWKRTGVTIDRQSDEQLLIAMRFVYLQSARDPQCASDAEVTRLNALVLREIVPQVGAALMQYMVYLRDVGRVPEPMRRGQATSVKSTGSGMAFRPPLNA